LSCCFFFFWHFLVFGPSLEKRHRDYITRKHQGNIKICEKPHRNIIIFLITQRSRQPVVGSCQNQVLVTMLSNRHASKEAITGTQLSEAGGYW
jgi:hypothetical protein